MDLSDEEILLDEDQVSDDESEGSDLDDELVRAQRRAQGQDSDPEVEAEEADADAGEADQRKQRESYISKDDDSDNGDDAGADEEGVTNIMPIYTALMRVVGLPLSQSNDDDSRAMSRRRKGFFNDIFRIESTFGKGTMSSKDFQAMKSRFEQYLASNTATGSGDTNATPNVKDAVMTMTIKWFVSFLSGAGRDLLNSKGHSLTDFIDIFNNVLRRNLLHRLDADKAEELRSVCEKEFLAVFYLKSGEEAKKKKKKKNLTMGKQGMFNELRRIFGVSELEQIKLDTQVKLNDENEQLEVFRTEIDVRLSMIESHPIYNKSYFMLPNGYEEWKVSEERAVMHLLDSMGLNRSGQKRSLKKGRGNEPDGEDGGVLEGLSQTLAAVKGEEQARDVNGHHFVLTHFNTPTFCSRCKGLLWGVGYQGYKCSQCSKTTHRKCLDSELPCLQKSTYLKGSRTEATAQAHVHLSFSFELQVQVLRARGLPPGKTEVYCQTEEESNSTLRYRTSPSPASAPEWDETSACPMSIPVGQVAISLRQVRTGLLDDKTLGRVTIDVDYGSLRNTNPWSLGKWVPLDSYFDSQGESIRKSSESDSPTKNKALPKGKVELMVRLKATVDRKCYQAGWVWCQGGPWKRWKKRYIIIYGEGDFEFYLAQFKRRKSEPAHQLFFDRHIVAYTDSVEDDVIAQCIPSTTGVYTFKVTKAGASTVFFAHTDSQQSEMWVKSIMAATKQTYVPTVVGKKDDKAAGVHHQRRDKLAAMLVGKSGGSEAHVRDRELTKLHRSLQHQDSTTGGVSIEVNHNLWYRIILRKVLKYEVLKCHTLGRLSPPIVAVLDDYVARYGVSDVHRKITYLQLLTELWRKTFLDPNLLHAVFTSCSDSLRSPIFGVQENDLFITVMDDLQSNLEQQISVYKRNFPFNKPAGALQGFVQMLHEIINNRSFIDASSRAQKIYVFMPKLLRKGTVERFSTMLQTTESDVERFEEMIQQLDRGNSTGSFGSVLSAFGGRSGDDSQQFDVGEQSNSRVEVGDMGQLGNWRQMSPELRRLVYLLQLILADLEDDHSYFEVAFSKVQQLASSGRSFFTLVQSNAAVLFDLLLDQLERIPSDVRSPKRSISIESFATEGTCLDVYQQIVSFMDRFGIAPHLPELSSRLCSLFLSDFVDFLDASEVHCVEILASRILEDPFDPPSATSTSEMIPSIFDLTVTLERRLNWLRFLSIPDQIVAEHVAHRFHVITMNAFQAVSFALRSAFSRHLQRSDKTAIPSQCLVAINSLNALIKDILPDFRSQIFLLSDAIDVDAKPTMINMSLNYHGQCVQNDEDLTSIYEDMMESLAGLVNGVLSQQCLKVLPRIRANPGFSIVDFFLGRNLGEEDLMRLIITTVEQIERSLASTHILNDALRTTLRTSIWKGHMELIIRAFESIEGENEESEDDECLNVRQIDFVSNLIEALVELYENYLTPSQLDSPEYRELKTKMTLIKEEMEK